MLCPSLLRRTGTVRRAITRRRLQRSAGLLLAGSAIAALCARSSLGAFDHTPAAAALQAQVVSPAKCMTFSISDSSGNPVSGGYASATVKLHSSGAVLMTSYGLATRGGLQLCYSGNGSLPGTLDISGYVDTNGNGVQDAGEPTTTGQT